MSTGEKIRQARKEAGLTQKELGKKLNVSQAAIAQYENEKSNLQLHTIRKIADTLGCSINTLIDDWSAYSLDEKKEFFQYGGKIASITSNVKQLTFEAINKVEEYTKDLLEVPKYRLDKKEPEDADTPK